MNYFTVTIQNENICSCFGYNSLDEAKSKWHKELNYGYEANITTLSVILNGEGRVLEHDKYTAHVQPAPELTPDEEEPTEE
ncbi:MAG TPA: hypothetical protein P5092_19820 [Ruminococcus sp.]|nr:hypothetical protein [Ruminococcus sp.]